MQPITILWADLKTAIEQRGLSVHYVVINGDYNVFAFDGPLAFTSVLAAGSPDAGDFEANYKPSSNSPLLPKYTAVTTLYETNDKNLDMGKFKLTIANGKGQVRLKVPGTFGAPDGGRYIAGGYTQLDTFDPDDYILLDIFDDDRVLAWAIAKSMNPNATAPLDDATMRTLSGLPVVGSVPSYPSVGSYNDTDMPAENQGWYFWPAPLGAGKEPQGEIEFEPIAGYGFLPSGFYLVVTVVRPNVATGYMRANLEWGSSAPLSTAFGG